MAILYSAETLKNFIAVEGLDGAGTSTQSQLLEKSLSRAGRKAALSMEPTAGPIGCLIKQIMRGRLKSAATREKTEKQLAHLFAADRFDHLYNETDGILSQIEKGYTAISTRYFFSSYAYNARTEEDLQFIQRLNGDFPLPEVVVYLTVPLATALERLERRDVREFYEQEEELLRVKKNYDRIFEPIRSRVVEFESTGNVEELAGRIAEAVMERLEG